MGVPSHQWLGAKDKSQTAHLAKWITISKGHIEM